LALAVPVDEHDVDDTEEIADNLERTKFGKYLNVDWYGGDGSRTYDDDFGRNVSWSVLRAEGLRANDVTSTVSD
jgi:hypothetical protein